MNLTVEFLLTEAFGKNNLLYEQIIVFKYLFVLLNYNKSKIQSDTATVESGISTSNFSVIHIFNSRANKINKL